MYLMKVEETIYNLASLFLSGKQERGLILYRGFLIFCSEIRSHGGMRRKIMEFFRRGKVSQTSRDKAKKMPEKDEDMNRA